MGNIKHSNSSKVKLALEMIKGIEPVSAICSKYGVHPSQALTIATPEIHNSDQGSQFTSFEYITKLREYPEIKISMDGRGRCFDNIFTERLWRTVKYEEVYLHDYQSFDEAQESLSQYFNLYNTRRLHSSLNYQTPQKVYFSKVENVSNNY